MPWSLNQGCGEDQEPNQVAQRKIYWARQSWIDFMDINQRLELDLLPISHLFFSFSFISIMQTISQEGKVPCTLFFLTTLQNSTSDRVLLCCQWYNENPLALLESWRIPLSQLEFSKLHSFFLRVCEDNIVNCKEMKGVRTEINSSNSAGIVFLWSLIRPFLKG